jgi:NIPSNAP
MHRYKFNPDHLTAITKYVDEEQSVIGRSGGIIFGSFLPRDFAGATDEAIGLIDLPSLSTYEVYRKALADDPGHKENIARLEQSGARVAMNRSVIRRVEPRR